MKTSISPTSLSTTRIAFTSFIGTAIEFYDFYICGLAVAVAAISVLAAWLIHETRDQDLA